LYTVVPSTFAEEMRIPVDCTGSMTALL